MSDVIWRERPELRAPVMVCAFRGWNDAGEAATAALSYIRGSFDARQVADIDPEDFYDFTAVRPSVKLTEGSMREIEWPQNSFSVAPVPGAEGDLVMLQGVEPSLRWRRFTEDVVTTASDLGVRMVITLGALSLWASVPHYVAASPNPKVALALVRAFEGTAGLAVDGGELESAAEDYERQVTAAVASDPEGKAFVERLQRALGDPNAEKPPHEEELPPADTIA